jgi:hypothetical protein
LNFQGGQESSSCLDVLPEDDEFKFVKRGKSKSSAASEFNIKTTNKIEALMKRAKIKIGHSTPTLSSCDQARQETGGPSIPTLSSYDPDKACQKSCGASTPTLSSCDRDCQESSGPSTPTLSSCDRDQACKQSGVPSTPPLSSCDQDCQESCGHSTLTRSRCDRDQACQESGGLSTPTLSNCGRDQACQETGGSSTLTQSRCDRDQACQESVGPSTPTLSSCGRDQMCQESVGPSTPTLSSCDDPTKAKVKITQKRFLKKCRNCNFKKLSCILNPSSCMAQQKNCFKCGKKGHFPQSMNCKTKIKSQKQKRGQVYEKRSSTKISKEVLLLLRTRIDELERPDCPFDESSKSFDQEAILIQSS